MKDSFVHLYISRAKNMTILIQQDTGYTSMKFFENTDYESCLQIFDRIVNGEEAGKHELHEDENEIISTLRSFLIDNPDIINDKRRIKAAIKDLFYDRGKLGNLLSLLIDYDIIHDIRTHAPVDEMFITRFENRLALDYGIECTMTRNAVRIWVQAIVRC